MGTPMNLTSEMVDEMLEQSRLQMEAGLAEAGPIAVSTLVEVMQSGARDSDRVAASKAVLDKVMAPAKPEMTSAARGPTIQIVINRLSTGRSEALPLPVTELEMDRIEAGLITVEGADD